MSDSDKEETGFFSKNQRNFFPVVASIVAVMVAGQSYFVLPYRMNDTRARLDDNKAAIEVLKTDRNSNRENIVAINSTIAGLRNDVSDLRAEVREIRAQLRSFMLKEQERK